MDKWLAPKYKSLMETNMLTDFQVIVCGKTFYCHKIILATCSKWFNHLFQDDMQTPSVKLDVNVEIFEKFRLYIYTYSVDELNDYDSKTVVELLKFGEKMFVNSLITECTRILSARIPKMAIEDLTSFFHCAHYTRNSTLLEVMNKSVSETTYSTLKSNQISVLATNKFSDCSIIIGEKTFKCHKFILASASEFFNRMFTGGFTESISEEIHLQDVTPEDFEIFRIYIYTRSTKPFSKYKCETVIQLLENAYKWFVPALIRDCTTALLDRIWRMKLHNLVNVFQYAHTFHNKILIESLKEELKRQPLLNGSQAMGLTYDVFREYLKLTSNKQEREVHRFNLVLSYIELNKAEQLKSANTVTENQSEIAKVKHPREADQVNGMTDIEISGLVKEIRLDLISSPEFLNGPGKSDVLHVYDKFEMISQIIGFEDQRKMKLAVNPHSCGSGNEDGNTWQFKEY